MRKTTFWLLLTGIVAGMALAWWIFRPLTTESGTKTTPTLTPTQTDTPTPTPTPVTRTFDEKPYAEGKNYFEKTPKIDGQQNYLVYPLTIDPQNPPVLVMYSHGSITTVTTNFKDQFMKDMRAYGHYFAERNYAYVASAQHGANWGSATAVQDMIESFDWIKKRYPVQPKMYLLAHSMGGLPSFNFTFKYPDKVAKMALLAPTSRPESWGSAQYNKLKSIDIRIWHGDKDVNVPYSLSTALVQDAKRSGITINLVTLKGKNHWDVDTELMKEVEEWFNND